jgi:hypothetical protein
MRTPELYKVIAKNLRLEFLADSQWLSPSMGSQKVTPEKAIAFAVTDMAVNGCLRAIAPVFVMTFPCVQCQ